MLVDDFIDTMKKEDTQKRRAIDFERVERIRRKSDELGFKKEFFEHYGHTMWKRRAFEPMKILY